MVHLLEKDSINSKELEELLKDKEAKKNSDFILVDVRENREYNRGYIDGVNELKPTSQFQNWSKELLEQYKDTTIIFTCRSGNRSRQIQMALKRDGHTKVINHTGGIISYHGNISK
jgi:rhodanese-related sulfurtransferase